MLSFLKKLFGIKSLNYPELISRGVMVIDVRTKGEFAQGSLAQAINIPMNEISQNLEKIQQENKVVITCCRSGIRSANAARILQKAGIEAYNGGTWQAVESGLASSI